MSTSDQRAVRAELQTLLKERAFRFGDFTLSSGRKSSYYFDGRQVTLDGRGLWLVSQLILARCRELNATAVGGLTLGADPIAAGVAMQSATDNGDVLKAFIVRKEEKTHGTGSRIAGPTVSSSDRVVLVDDTTTTGNSFIVAQDALRESGANILEAVVIVDREEGAEAALQEHGMKLHSLFRRSDFV